MVFIQMVCIPCLAKTLVHLAYVVSMSACHNIETDLVCFHHWLPYDIGIDCTNIVDVLYRRLPSGTPFGVLDNPQITV